MLTDYRTETPHVHDEDAREKLVLVSNRGPVCHRFNAAGRLERVETGGGVATALSRVAAASPVTWLASAASPADRMLAIAGRGIEVGPCAELRFVDVPAPVFAPFYQVFCNPVLWFVQHGLEGMLERDPAGREVREAWDAGYRAANAIYAEAVLQEVDATGASRVMFHDYHFYLAPGLVRRARPDLTLQHFVHIPWPEPHAWSALPRDIVAAICRGLLGNDSLVFQTDESVGNFLATCALYLGDEAAVSTVHGQVSLDGRTTDVWANPISVDVPALRADVLSAEAAAYRRALEAPAGMKTIVRVDRLDPSKNVLEGFQAYERLLCERPEWRGRVRFLAFLVPSREAVPEFRRYRDRTLALADRINGRFGRPGWQPVRVFHEQNRLQALAALTLYDVLLVNPVRDGMNLVSKEGPVLNERDGVLVLSDRAGSYEELGGAALGVSPGDPAATAAALHQALSMSAAERHARHCQLVERIERHQLRDWLRLLMKDFAIAEYVKALAPAQR
jgi:trehalose 6-phosphate synthase